MLSIPDTKRLAEIFSEAIAPTFFLGAVAAFVSLMTARLSGIVDRLRTLNAIADDDRARAHLKVDLDRLRRRARLLTSGIQASLRAGLCATLLLILIFGSEFFGLHHVYGAGLLFVIAAIFLGFALYRFAQEERISLSAADEHH